MASTPTPTFFGFAYFNGNEAVLENYLEADRFFLNSWHFSLGISATFCHFSDERQRLYVVGIFLQMFIKFLGMFSTPLNCHNSIQCVLWNFLLFTLFLTGVNLTNFSGRIFWLASFSQNFLALLLQNWDLFTLSLKVYWHKKFKAI